LLDYWNITKGNYEKGEMADLSKKDFSEWLAMNFFR
jgi:hypothetical protein